MHKAPGCSFRSDGTLQNLSHSSSAVSGSLVYQLTSLNIYKGKDLAYIYSTHGIMLQAVCCSTGKCLALISGMDRWLGLPFIYMF